MLLIFSVSTLRLNVNLPLLRMAIFNVKPSIYPHFLLRRYQKRNKKKSSMCPHCLIFWTKMGVFNTFGGKFVMTLEICLLWHYIFGFCRARRCRWCIALLHRNWGKCKWTHILKITSVFIVSENGKKLLRMYRPIMVIRCLLKRKIPFVLFVSMLTINCSS